MANDSASYKAPPAMRDELPYKDWKTEIEIWSDFTDLKPKKKGGALFLTLTGKARETVRSSLTTEQISDENGVNSILTALDSLYLKDAEQAGFLAYENFISYKRSKDTPIKDFVIEFNLRYSKLKTYDMALPQGVLAYNLLSSANLTVEQQQLCRATTPKMTYEDMRMTIEKVTLLSGTASAASNTKEERFIPIETEDAFYTRGQTEDAFYTRGQGGYQGGFAANKNSSPRLNPPDSTGLTSTCSYCHSIYHWVQNCPDATNGQADRGRPYQRGRGHYRLKRSGRGSYNKPL